MGFRVLMALMVCTCLCTSFTILAQGSLTSSGHNEDGFVIGLKGDTIRGQIRSKIENNKRYCEFKSGDNDHPKLYSPNEIIGYRMNDGKYFVSIKIDTVQMFLEYLVKGELNVYYNSLQNGYPEYFVDKNGEIKALMNSKEWKSNNGIKYYDERKEYLVVLYDLLKDADLEEEIEKTDLDKVSLIQLSLNYHHKVCNDYSCVIYENRFSDLYSMFLGVNWSKGYILKDNNEEIEGYISYNLASNEGVLFKPLFYADNTKEFFADDIKEFRTEEDKYYVTKSFKDSLAIFQILATGEFNIYSRGVDRQFFVERDSIIYELNNSIRTYYWKGNTVKPQTRNEFVGVLIYLMRDADMKDEIEKTKLDKKSLIRLIEKYQKKIGSTMEVTVY